MIKRAFIQSNVLLLCAISMANAQAQTPLKQASESAAVAGHALDKVHRWLHEIALPKIDTETGLYKADGKWNYRDTAADCYPFLLWAAHTVDEDVLNGPVRSILHREQALCNTIGEIPAPFDFETGTVVANIEWDELVFQASEYVKDGLIAMVEVTGPDEWFDRMRALQDDLWANARVDTPFGKIVSENIEVNGEQLQALARLYTMTGNEKYLDWADRIADYYFADPDFMPTRLRDHGCEIIGGLGLLHAVETTHRPTRAAIYETRLKKIYDEILARGCNEDGMMYNTIDQNGGQLSDGWGYNYVGFLCYDMATGTTTYRNQVARTLGNLMKPDYKDYDWERGSIDGFADSIEGAIYLLNHVPVDNGFEWVNRETIDNMVDHPTRLENGDLWGTMKLQSNGVRTVIMHALMHTRGIIARPWQQGFEIGAAPDGEGVAIVIRSEQDYTGVLEFDLPRHRVYMGFQKDWPRMNTLPEWFTVEPEDSYTVKHVDTGVPATYTGRQLHAGLEISLQAGEILQLLVTPASDPSR